MYFRRNFPCDIQLCNQISPDYQLERCLHQLSQGHNNISLHLRAARLNLVVLATVFYHRALWVTLSLTEQASTPTVLTTFYLVSSICVALKQVGRSFLSLFLEVKRQCAKDEDDRLFLTLLSHIRVCSNTQVASVPL